MSVELVVFDMAGTTVYDGDAVNRCLQAALHTAGVATNRTEVNEVMGLPKPIAIRAILQQHALEGAVSDTNVMEIHNRFLERMLAYYRTDPEMREAPGATALFQRLKQSGVKVALDTGFSRVIADTVIERLGWQRDGLLDATVTSDEVPKGRPYPDLIHRVMQLTGISNPRRVAKVGDTPSDLQEGEAASCRWVIGVTSGSHTREQLEPFHHTHLIERLAELPEILLDEERDDV